ncbi:hypothetical protein ILUMI_19619 [Ignelater luminosus]|uniref:C2 domain-containing protein n=1 Tax=Ignelater luminosus TaxID=2038154 RepID=A0A8K0CFV0_IGNLU|nr:hypothetical protein ILUMI_19619 [Ignelater luminosus]
MFWGVRELQKIFLLPVTRPKITIECAYKTLHSETITNTQKTLNFTQPIKSLDVNLPDQEDMLPPLCIKLFDCRSFGRYTLVGTQVINVKYFVCHPTTKQEWYQMLLKAPSLEDNKRLSIEKQTVDKKKGRSDLSKKKNKERLRKFNKIYDENIKETAKKLKTPRKRKRVICADIKEGADSSGKSRELKQEIKVDFQLVPCDKHPCNPTKDKGTTCCSKASSSRLHSPRKTDKKKKKKKHKDDKHKKSKKENGEDVQSSEKQIKEEKTPSISATISSVKSSISSWLKTIYNKPKEKILHEKEPIEEKQEEELSDEHDWWTRYYASVEVHESKGTHIKRKKECTLIIYPDELEARPEFQEFTDTLQNFKLYKGKRTGDESVDETNITAIFKGALKVYKWPLEENLEYVTRQGFDVTGGYFQNFPHNTTLNFVLRIYCVKGINLRPKDIGGKSDPYIVIKMSNHVINDRNFYVPKQINPIFGRCFELKGKFPHDHAIIVSIWDWDLTSADDLIGETKIDIENRFYSKHRAHCGISGGYYEMGNCAWRDAEKPTRILDNLCRVHNLNQPVFREKSIKIVDTEFYLPSPKAETESSDVYKEKLALCALRRWDEIPLIGYSLVPEHVETRSLYHPSKLGVEQVAIILTNFCLEVTL